MGSKSDQSNMLKAVEAIVRPASRRGFLSGSVKLEGGGVLAATGLGLSHFGSAVAQDATPAADDGTPSTGGTPAGSGARRWGMSIPKCKRC